jgi:hypothetical protein
VVGDIRDPRLVSPRHRELPLEEVGDQDGGLTDRPAPRAIAVQGAQLIDAHQPCDAVLAAGLSGLSQVEKDTRRAVNALTRGKRRTDQAEQPGILLRPVRHRVREPLVVPARGHAEHTTHCLRAEFASIGLDELVRRPTSPRAQLHGHRHRLRDYPAASYCPLNPGNSKPTINETRASSTSGPRGGVQ